MYQVDRASNLYWSGYSDADAMTNDSIASKTEDMEQTKSDSTAVEENAITSGERSNLARANSATPVPTSTSAIGMEGASAPPEIKEEIGTPNLGANNNILKSSSNSLATNGPNQIGSQGDLLSPTLNPALVNKPVSNRGNPLGSPTQPGATFASQIAMQNGHMNQHSQQQQQQQQAQQQQP
ncbi:hypothetical protein BGZ76_006150, partial [Entomortierella beljakovae]